MVTLRLEPFAYRVLFVIDCGSIIEEHHKVTIDARANFTDSVFTLNSNIDETH